MLQPILKIDLTTGQQEVFVVPQDWARDYLGAASLAARLLYDQLQPEFSPFSPEAPLLFLNGPLTGTAGPAVGRFVVAGRSPATGLWAESNCGGFWGPELRKAGFDGIWVTGHSPEPVYIWVRDGQAGIAPASDYWGMDTYSTQAALQNALGGKSWRVACVGPAGEAAVPYALIHCDHGRVAGRTGMGAVMGSKNLKAIVVRGTGKVPLVNWERYLPLRAQANRELRDDNPTVLLRQMGTAGLAEYFDYLGEMPKKYFTSGLPHEGAGKISGATISETILTGVSACHACVIACGRVVTLEDGVPRKGPEYETLAGFGPNLLIDDPAAITRMGELCDRYGMDSISLSNTIGLAISLFDEGRITLEDTGGIALEWSNPGLVEELIRLAAHRQGFGGLLALGARDLGRHFNAEEAAVQVNGLEVAYHDPRGASGMALVYATSPRGACHNQSDYFVVDIGQVEEQLGLEYYDRHAGAEKAANVARHQDWVSLLNSLVLCMFANVPPVVVLELLNAGLKLDWTMQEMLKVGERGWTLKRVINHRLGLTRANDVLPKALRKAYLDGGAEGFAPDLDTMLSAYYQARSWDPLTGRPTPALLASLGLDWLIPDLWS